MHNSNGKGKRPKSDVYLRLKRAKGHLETVIGMLESEKSCLTVTRQLHAVSKALMEAKRVFIEEHIGECLDIKALDRSEMTLKDFKEMTKYL